MLTTHRPRRRRPRLSASPAPWLPTKTAAEQLAAARLHLRTQEVRLAAPLSAIDHIVAETLRACYASDVARWDAIVGSGEVLACMD